MMVAGPLSSQPLGVLDVIVNDSKETGDAERLTKVLESRKHIPKELVKFVALCIEEGTTNRLVQELQLNEAATADALDGFFLRSSEATELDPAAVLSATGFSWRDLDPSRIESAIAQLRAIFFLDAQGFTDIKLIPTQAGRSSDMVAIRGKRKFAVEVANSIYGASSRFTSEQLASWAFSRWESEGKNAQIEATSQEHGCERGAFIAVISTQNAAALQTHPEFSQAAALAWDYIGSPQHIHVCMVTGREAPGYGPDDAVSPPWEE
jgi:hypothetical protein